MIDKVKLLDDNLDRLFKSSAKIRGFLDALLDEKSLVETDTFLAGKSFLDGVCALGEGVITGYASIDGQPVYFFAQNSEVLSGSLSMAQADKIVKNMYAAATAHAPFLSIIDSAGARIGEGIAVAEGYAKLIRAANDIGREIPHIAVIKGNCVGLTAAFAGTADFLIADEKSKLALNSPNVIAAVSKCGADKLSAKNLAERTDAIPFTYKTVDELKDILVRLLDLITDYSAEYSDDLNRREDALNESALVDTVLNAALDDGKSLELYSGYAKEVKTGIGRIAGNTVAFIAFDSAVNPFITLLGIKKLTKFLYSVSSFGLPLVNFVDSKGVEPSIEGELAGLAGEASSLLTELAIYDSPKISVITGNAIGFSYTAFAAKKLGYNYTLATCDAVISPVNPETATVLLYDEELKSANDPIAKRAELNKKYAEESANPFIAAKDGFVDNIIEPALIRPYLSSALLMLL